MDEDLDYLIEETVQDDVREIQVCNLLNLTQSTDRNGPYDATCERNIQYELKSTAKSNMSFIRKITDETFRRKFDQPVHWIFTYGKKFKSKEYIIHSMYYLPPDRMKPYFDHLRSKLNDNFAFVDSYVDWSKVEQMSVDDKDRFMRQRRNAASMTDPFIKWSYVTSNGYEVKEPYAENLRLIQDRLAQGEQIAFGPVVEDILF